MDIKNTAGVIAGVIITILLFVTAVLPIVSDAQITSGDPVTYTNAEGGIRVGYYEEDFTMTVTSSSATINDYELSRPASGSPRIILWEYGRLIYYSSGDNVCRVEEQSIPYSHTFATSVTVTYDYSESLLTVTDGDITQEITAREVMAIAADGDHVIVNSTSFPSRYYNEESIQNFGYLQGSVTIDDTVYLVNVNKDGVDVYGLDGYTSSMSVVGGHIVSGTTDVYTGGTPTAIISYEGPAYAVNTFSIGSAVIYEIHGHKDSGAVYSMVGILPILIMAGILIAITGMILSRRE